MTRYKNLNGNSGISAYEIADKAITIRFTSGDTYVYSYTVTGRKAVEDMKSLALTGQGLGTYISQHVKERYEAKL